jgi:predicted nucleotidyltransferase
MVEEVRALGRDQGLLGIVLLGGYARGEGTVVTGPDGELRGFNDYDLLVVFERAPERVEPWHALARRLAVELEIDFVDLGLAGRDDLRQAAPILFWYELGEAHRWLWIVPGAKLELPRFTQGSLEASEPSRLMINRGMGHLWGALRLWPEGGPGEGPPTSDPRAIQFAVIACHKAVLSAGDAALIGARAYSLHQEERRKRLQENPRHTAWAGKGFVEAYGRATEFRRSPTFPPIDAVQDLWWEARAHHEAGFRAAEEHRLGLSLGNWDAHARIVRSRALHGRWRRPRTALRSLAGGMRGRSWMDAEETLFTNMPGLLYGPRRVSPGASLNLHQWRRRSEDLVRRWHP